MGFTLLQRTLNGFQWFLLLVHWVYRVLADLIGFYSFVCVWNCVFIQVHPDLLTDTTPINQFLGCWPGFLCALWLIEGRFTCFSSFDSGFLFELYQWGVLDKEGFDWLLLSIYWLHFEAGAGPTCSLTSSSHNQCLIINFDWISPAWKPLSTINRVTAVHADKERRPRLESNCPPLKA